MTSTLTEPKQALSPNGGRPETRPMVAERASRLRPCETCGNAYDKTFAVVINGAAHVFDSFECAIQALAPICSHCQCRIIGHGVEEGGIIYCCVHCAKQAGVAGLRDRA